MLGFKVVDKFRLRGFKVLQGYRVEGFGLSVSGTWGNRGFGFRALGLVRFIGGLRV